MLFNHRFNTHRILYIVLQIRNCETSICLRVTWPRWPRSQEWAWGLLKHAILCVYQACRTNSFAVQKMSRATGAAASTARSWQMPVQLRASWRTDILQDRQNDRLRWWWLVAVKWKQVRPVFLQKQMPQQFKLNFLWQIFNRFRRKFFYTHIIVHLRKTNLLHFSRPNPPNCLSFLIFHLLCC